MKSTPTKREAESCEICIVFIGIEQKSVFFDKLRECAIKTERHVNYADTHYLKFNVDGEEVVVELVDPGLEHTGAREMSIRKAHGAILFYSSYSAPSYHQLADLIKDFGHHKSNAKLPILLIANEDDYFDEECCETSSTGQSSVSEGYESETPQVPRKLWKRRISMEKMRICDEEKIPLEQGKQLAQLFGPECKFVSATMSNFTDTRDLIEEMIRSIRGKQSHKTNFLARTRAATFPKERTKNGVRNSGKRASSLKETAISKDTPETAEKTRKLISTSNASTACTIS